MSAGSGKPAFAAVLEGRTRYLVADGRAYLRQLPIPSQCMQFLDYLLSHCSVNGLHVRVRHRCRAPRLADPTEPAPSSGCSSAPSRIEDTRTPEMIFNQKTRKCNDVPKTPVNGVPRHHSELARGLEPLTCCLQDSCATDCATPALTDISPRRRCSSRRPKSASSLHILLYLHPVCNQVGGTVDVLSVRSYRSGVGQCRQ